MCTPKQGVPSRIVNFNHRPQALGERGSHEFVRKTRGKERVDETAEWVRQPTWKLMLMTSFRGCRHKVLPREVGRTVCPHAISETLESKADVI